MRRNETMDLRLFHIPSREGVPLSSFSSLLEDERLILNETGILFLHQIPSCLKNNFR
jgi:hypothetical protein